ncbi:MAG: MFS transporter [Eisenbergiella massiliensis]
MLTAGFFGIIAVLLFYFLFFTVKERVKAETSREKGLGKDLLVVVKSPVWLLFFFMVFMVFGNMFMRISSTTYYFIYVAGRPDLIGIFFMIVTLVQIPGAILVNLLSKVMNRKKIFYFCGISSAVVFAGCYFVRNLVLFFVLEALGGILITMLIPLLAATIGDIADYFVKEKKYKSRRCYQRVDDAFQ